MLCTGSDEMTQMLSFAQERMRSGPHFGISPRLLQAITETPELLQVIMSRTGRVLGPTGEPLLDLHHQDRDNPQAGCIIS